MMSKIAIQTPEDLARAFELETFLPRSRCTICDADSSFAIDTQSTDLFMLYRESARCVKCNLVGRQRVVMTRVKQCAKAGDVIYLQEQVTASYQWAVQTFKDCTVIGSEYMPLGVLPGIRYEDVHHLSFETHSIDIIVSQDVFEHVADPWQGFNECYRVLKPGGVMLMTIPFAGQPAAQSVNRVKLGLAPVYHGNPLSDQGSLVYTDFGWDIKSRLTKLGFDVALSVYRNNQLGWPSPVLLFELFKPLSSIPTCPK
jgi:SAM-dependent methyltransferase